MPTFFLFFEIMENIQNILDDLFSRHRAGIKPGLERTLLLLEKLENPHLNIKCIHIAGTNGKGTCSSILASYFQENGNKVGLYTSPHILEFNERIRINSNKIPNSYIAEKYQELKEKIEEIDATFFEITTVIAFKYFSDNNCDICIIETGLGGRFDCTNTINPILSIITSISIDHKEYLGDTIEEIAFEKAGIIKQNTPVVLGLMNDNALDIMKIKAENENSEILQIEETLDKLILIEESNFTCYYKYDNYEIDSELIGEHNKINFAITITALKALKIFNFDTYKRCLENIRKNTGYFARLSVLRKSPYFIIDTAHNYEAINYNVKAIAQNTGNKFLVVYTGMKDKDNFTNLGILRDIAEEFILTQTSQSRNESLENLANYCEKLEISNYKLINSVSEVLKSIENSDKNILVIGSFFLAAEVLEQLRNYGSMGLESLSKS